MGGRRPAESRKPPRTAPGWWIEAKVRLVARLPGPPAIVEASVSRTGLPRLRITCFGLRMCHRDLRVTRARASHVERHPPAPRYPQVKHDDSRLLPRSPIHLRVWNRRPDTSRNHFGRKLFRTSNSRWETAFSPTGTPLEDVVANSYHQIAPRFRRESCPGPGLLAERLPIPGSATIFWRVDFLRQSGNVWTECPPELIASKSAVSAEWPVALARHSPQRGGLGGVGRGGGGASAATFWICITGIAGPCAASRGKTCGHCAHCSGTPAEQRCGWLHLPSTEIFASASQLSRDQWCACTTSSTQTAPAPLNPSCLNNVLVRLFCIEIPQSVPVTVSSF